MTQPRPPAILLGGTENAVSAARSLSRAGVQVHAVGDAGGPVRWSRACAAFVDPPGPGDVQDRWLAWLLGHDAPAAVLLPCDDDGLELIARHRGSLRAKGFLPVEADDGVLLEMLDKDRTYALARSAGLPTPATWTLRDLDDLARIDGDVPFPCALKPAESHLWRRHAGATSKAVVVHDRYELDRESRRWLGKGLVMLVTEIIPGPEEAFASYYSYLDPSGRPILHLTKRKLRQNPPGFGRGCYHVTEWVPEVAELGLAFFQRVGLRGLGSVEFKRDSRDGSYKLIECNHRMTAANEQLRRAGVDLALLLYNRAAGLPDPPLQRWSHGVRLWYPLADLRALRRLRSDGELTVAQWVRSVAHRQHLAVFRWSDPLPSVGYGLARLIRLGRRLARRAEASPRDPSEEGVPPGGGAGRTSSATSPR